LPTLQFFVNGVQIGGNMTLSSNAGQWQEFSAVWNSASASSATIIIYDVNSLYENAGDDFALDDLSLVVLP
jgi:hypothetical protein